MSERNVKCAQPGSNKPIPAIEEFGLSSFTSQERLWKSFSVTDDDRYKFQGKMQGVFGVYVRREYPPTLGLEDAYCIIQIMDYDDADSDPTQLTFSADMHTERRVTATRRPIDIRTSDIRFDHQQGKFLLGRKRITGEKVLDYVWGLHLSTTYRIRGLPLRTKRRLNDLFGKACDLLDVAGAAILRGLYGYSVEKDFEDIDQGHISSQVKEEGVKRTMFSLGDSPTFEIFKVKVKTASGIIWCFIVASLSLTKKHIPVFFAGSLSNATFALAWSVLLLWTIDRVIPKTMLFVMNKATRLRFRLLWALSSIHKIWIFYI